MSYLVKRVAFLAFPGMTGFDLVAGSHPIIPVMFPGEDGARRASAIADAMLADGVYVIAFSYPVVPAGKARIRVQLSAAHTEADVRAALERTDPAFAAVRARFGPDGDDPGARA